MFSNKLFTENKIKVLFKLLTDLLMVFIIFFALALIAEGLLPGIVSSRIGLYKIVITIMLVLWLLNVTAKKIGIDINHSPGKKSSSILIFILAALIFNGMLGVGLPLSIFILILSLAVLYLFFKLFFPPAANS